MCLVFYLTISCYQENARYPIDHAKKSFLNNSAERNKLLLAREEILIKKVLEKENSLSFMLSEKLAATPIVISSKVECTPPWGIPYKL